MKSFSYLYNVEFVEMLKETGDSKASYREIT
jgi:hypothetical protein